MRFFPVFLDLAAGPVVLAGAGHAAQSKLRLLRSAGARVRWHLPDSAASLHPSDDQVEMIVGTSSEQIDLSDAVAVVSAAGDPHDGVIAARARTMRIPVNVVDRPELSTFIVPAIVDRGDVVVAIGTGGLAPVLARRLRARIEALLPARIGELAALMGRYRARLAAVLKESTARRRFWEHVVDGPIGAAVLAGRPLEAEGLLARAVGKETRRPNNHGGIVRIDARDPDLLTLRDLHALLDADVVAYDESVSPAVLGCVRRDAEHIVLGDGNANGPRLLAAARAGRRVVVLRRDASDARHVPAVAEAA